MTMTLFAAIPIDDSYMGTRTFDAEGDMLNYATDCLKHGHEVDTYCKAGDAWERIDHYWPPKTLYGL